MTRPLLLAGRARPARPRQASPLAIVCALAALAAAWLATSCGPRSQPGPAAPGPTAAPLPRRLEVAQLEARRTAGVPRLLAVAGAPAATGAPDAPADSETRVLALRALGRIGDPDSIDALIAALDDPEPRVAQAAARALGVAGVGDAGSGAVTPPDTAARVQDALIRAYRSRADVENDNESSDIDSIVTQAAAIEALGRVGDDGALATLTRALLQGEPAVAEAAAIAMGRFGRRGLALDAAARGALVRSASEPAAALRYGVAFALAREKLPDPPGDHDPAAPAADISPVLALLKLARDTDPETRAVAVFGLARRTARIEALLDALDDADWRVRVQAVRGLAGAKDPRSARAAAAAFVVKTWALIAATGAGDVDAQGSAAPGPAPGSIHVVTEGLRALAAAAADKPVREAADALHRMAGDALAGGQPADPLGASTVHCLAADLRVRAGAELALLRSCGGPVEAGMPAHARAELLARTVVATRPGGEALAELTRLFADRDPRVRGAAVAAVADLVPDSPDSPDSPDQSAQPPATPPAKDSPLPAVLAMLAKALADPAIEVAGAAADAAATLAKRGVDITALAKPLLDRAAREEGEVELWTTLLAALTAAEIPGAAPLCQRARAAANRTVRGHAHKCLGALGGDASKNRATPAEPAAPPADVARVIGKTVTWHLDTTRGAIVIALDPDATPWHVAVIADLTERGFYRGLPWHRVVPDFVVQGGDPNGSGWGGPGFAIPGEPSAGEFARGAVGIADAGPDTGGSQIFIMHSRAAHLEGRYTRIGQVVRGMDTVDALMVGDRIRAARVEITPRAR